MELVELRKAVSAGEMYSISQKIGKEKAEAILALMPRNRQVSQERVKRIVDAMRSGRWQDNHPQGLIFNKAAELIDGQHRLLAVIEADVEIWFWCTFNADDTVKTTLDSGSPRTIAQTGQIIGLETTATDVAIAKALMIKIEEKVVPRMVDTQELLAIFEQYQEGIHLAGLRKSSQPILYAPIRAAIARAFYCLPDAGDKLHRFIEVLDSGFSEGAAESAAIALRNAYLNMPRRKSSSKDAKISMAAKAVLAVQKFAEGESVRSLGEAKRQLFPLKIDG